MHKRGIIGEKSGTATAELWPRKQPCKQGNLQKMSLPPSLHYNTVNQSGTFNSCCIIIQNAIWKCGTNCVRPSKIFRARSYRGTANILVQRNIKYGRRTHALIKFLISSTVWVRFILQTILVPSANRIWTLVVGSDWSTSNRVEEWSLSMLDGWTVDRVGGPPATGNEPGMEVLDVPILEVNSGTTAPRRWPDPAKTFKPFGGT